MIPSEIAKEPLETVDCFGFRTFVNPKGKETLEGPDGERYPLIHGPVRLFSRFKYISFSIDGYRAQSAKLMIAAIPKGLISLIHRIWDLGRLGFYRRSSLYAQTEIRKLAFFARSSNRPADSKEMKWKMFRVRCSCLASCLGKDLAKIVTFPVYLAAVESFFILGTFLVKPGRLLVAKVQRLWEFDNLLERTQAFAGLRDYRSYLDMWNSSMIHYIAPCYLSLEDSNRLDLHLNMNWFHPRGLYSLWSVLSHELRTFKDLVPKNKVEEFEKKLDDVKTDIKRICAHSSKEVNYTKEGKPELLAWPIGDVLRTAMESTNACLQKYVDGLSTLSDLDKSFDDLK